MEPPLGMTVVTSARRDVAPPVWRARPSIVWAAYYASSACRTPREGEAEIELAVPVADRSPLRIRVAARLLAGGRDTMRADEIAFGGRVRIRWPSADLQPGERYVRVDCGLHADGSRTCDFAHDYLRPGDAYEALVCAEDAAGNHSCWPKRVRFIAPAPVGPAEPCDERAAAAPPDRPLERVAEAMPPYQPLERAPLLLVRIDWQRARGLGAALAAALFSWTRARRRARFARLARGV
jgi:hypothetical protein